MINQLRNQLRKRNQKKAREAELLERKIFLENGSIPWSKGYESYKYETIKNNLEDENLLKLFDEKKELPKKYGYRLDERIVEYPWIISNLEKGKTKLLDAGSTFNFEFLVNRKDIKSKELTIYTFYPENVCFYNNRINYVFGDLRDLPFKDSLFEEIVCQSTLEHIDMDNSMYGYELSHKTEVSYEYLKVIQELERVLVGKGVLLLTFPFGKYENHGFFQQFDSNMLQKMLDILHPKGQIELVFYQYTSEGWILSDQEASSNCESYNPHTQKGKGDDFAAHSRGICCVKFIKD